MADLTEYLLESPAGATFGGQCSATAHAHNSPDVPLRMPCPVHGDLVWWCGGCAEIYCPDKLGTQTPHQLQLKP